MVKILGIHFAPLHVPWERRCQTALLTLFTMNFFINPVLLTVGYVYIFFTKYYYLGLLYAVWLWYDRDTCNRGGRRCAFICNAEYWEYIRDYFPMHLVKTAELDTKRNYILGLHPHGQVCAGPAGNFAYKIFEKTFPGIRFVGVTLKLHFFWPILREIILTAGLCSVTQASIRFLLTKSGTGVAVGIVPGGSAEVMEAHPGRAVVLLKNRKGFIRMAIKNGAALVPVYTFGENEIYSQAPNPEGSLIRKIQVKFKDITGIPLYLVNGRGIFQYTFGILPRRHPIYSVVGKPIEVEQNDNPNEDMVNKYHSIYMESLQQLFDEYKVKFGETFANQMLVIK